MLAVSSGVEKNSRLISDFIVKNKPLSFGLPYMGSKNKIAAELIRVLPGGNVFVDLFAGGCAMTHAALWSGKYRKVIANDIQRQFPDLFFRSITGHLTAHDRRAVDREEFERMKDHDAAVALLWSFGNAGENYLWNRDLEPVKLAAFNMIMCDDKKERYYWFKKFIQGLREARDELERRKNQRASILDQIWDSKEFLRKELRTALEASGKTQAEVNRHLGTQMAGHYFGKSQWSFPTREEFEKLREILPTLRPFDYYGQHLQSLESLQRLERLQSLESLQRLERLQMLESLQSLGRLQRLESLQILGRLQRLPENSVEERLTISGKDYAEISIPRGGVVYADPPYEGTMEYNGAPFNHARFWEWCRTRDFPVYISEYSAPSDFVEIWRKNKTCTFSSHNNAKKTVEKLFVHQRFNQL